MTVLVWAESDNGALIGASLSAIGAARALAPIVVMVGGDPRAAAQAATLEGVRQVLHLDSGGDCAPRCEVLAPAVITALNTLDCSHLLAAGTTQGRALLPRVAALLDVMALSDVVGIVDGDTFVRPVHAGAALMTLRSTDRVKVLTVRASAFAAASNADTNVAGGASADTSATTAAPIRVVTLARGEASAEPTCSARLLEQIKPAADGLPELIGARIVVSGGRGVGSAEGYARLQPVARRLGAALGASRAAVDAGYAAGDQQVGQTGKAVAPDLYLAFGISGAIQHLAGMKDSKTIVAINTDPEAPIFQIADYGLTADMFDVLPQLERALAAAAAATVESSA